MFWSQFCDYVDMFVTVSNTEVWVLTYINEAGVDVVTSWFSVSCAQMNTVMIVFVGR